MKAVRETYRERKTNREPGRQWDVLVHTEVRTNREISLEADIQRGGKVLRADIQRGRQTETQRNRRTVRKGGQTRHKDSKAVYIMPSFLAFSCPFTAFNFVGRSNASAWSLVKIYVIVEVWVSRLFKQSYGIVLGNRMVVVGGGGGGGPPPPPPPNFHSLTK